MIPVEFLPYIIHTNTMYQYFIIAIIKRSKIKDTFFSFREILIDAMTFPRNIYHALVKCRAIYGM